MPLFYITNHPGGLNKIYENLFLILKNKASSHSLLGGLNLNLITISRQSACYFEAINIAILELIFCLVTVFLT